MVCVHIVFQNAKREREREKRVIGQDGTVKEAEEDEEEDPGRKECHIV